MDLSSILSYALSIITIFVDNTIRFFLTHFDRVGLASINVTHVVRDVVYSIQRKIRGENRK